MCRLLGLVLLCACVSVGPCVGRVYRDYCVVGAGPGGLQVAYFLESAGRDYVVFEKSNTPGNFYTKFPRHRKLISINKRNTPHVNPEFKLRHDWNSLLSHDPDLLMTKYSKDMFPHADVLVKYLRDYQTQLGIKVQYNTSIHNIQKVSNASAPDGHVFTMEDERGGAYTCRTMVLATGLSTPNIPDVKGIELTEGYETVSIDPEDFEGKSVLILGRGNSAFETAQHIYGSTSFIHMTARSRARLAWATHYVGDLRAVNNELLDTYMLKSLDGLFESDLVEADIEIQRLRNGKIGIIDSQLNTDYDVIIRALGFIFDDSVFNHTSVATSRPSDKRKKKYPEIRHNYESTDHQGLFYAGTATHSLDFRKSAGGFIHGFRYTARALHRLLEWRYESSPWPAVTVPVTELTKLIVKRVNEASGPYQMVSFLGDVAIFSKDHRTVTFLQEFPVNLLHELPLHTGHEVNRGQGVNNTGHEVSSPVMVILMQYGHDFSGPGKDVFRYDRANGEPSEAHTSNFLHPVLYYYKDLPTEAVMKSRDRRSPLPRPDALHHVLEDFNTEFTDAHSHILPLRRFLEHVTGLDLRNFFSQTCFEIAMTVATLPESCRGYMAGRVLGDTDFHNMASSLVGTDTLLSNQGVA